MKFALVRKKLDKYTAMCGREHGQVHTYHGVSAASVERLKKAAKSSKKLASRTTLYYMELDDE